MASLTEISINTRRVIRYGVYAIILIIIARFTFNMTVLIYKRLNPPPPPPPTVAFGKIPSLPFPAKDMPLFEDLRYSLETADGVLPEFPLSLPIYVLIPRTPEIRALEQAQLLASNLGFDKNGKLKLENVKNVYDFASPKSPSTLTVNIVTGMFSISYNLQADPSAIQTFPPSVEDAKREALTFFGKVDDKNKDLEQSITSTEFLRSELNNQKLELVPAFSQSDSQFIKVNLFRKNYGSEKEYPSVTAKMPEGNIWILYGGNDQKRLIAAEYRYFSVDETKFATYPLLTAEDAWNKLKEGDVYIARIKTGAKQVVIRKVYLAYYDPDSYTPYYQPVVVFEGDNDFIGYVPAIDPEYYGSEE